MPSSNTGNWMTQYSSVAMMLIKYSLTPGKNTVVITAKGYKGEYVLSVMTHEPINKQII